MKPLEQLDIHLPITAHQLDFLRQVAKHMRCTVGELVFSAAMGRLTTDWGECSDNDTFLTGIALEELRRFIDQRDDDFDVWISFDYKDEQEGNA